jgi:hypothetical protein
MTPKEKAKELVDKYKSIEIEIADKYHGYGGGDSYLQMDSQDAKQCALIAVDEMINSYTSENENGYINSEQILTYWKKVKKEIENL